MFLSNAEPTFLLSNRLMTDRTVPIHHAHCIGAAGSPWKNPQAIHVQRTAPFRQKPGHRSTKSARSGNGRGLITTASNGGFWRGEHSLRLWLWALSWGLLRLAGVGITWLVLHNRGIVEGCIAESGGKSCSVATKSHRQLHGWILLPLTICAFGAHS